MEEIKLKQFDELLETVNKIKSDLIGDKIESKKKERFLKIEQRVTLFIAIVSFAIGIFTVINSLLTDSRNYRTQRENDAYNFWLSYLRLAVEKPEMANGLKEIYNVPIDDLACRKKNREKYPDSTEAKFVDYAWFVANALGTAEIVYDLTSEDDAWNATIDTLIRNHITYIRSKCFESSHYSDFLNEKIDKMKSMVTASR